MELSKYLYHFHVRPFSLILTKTTCSSGAFHMISYFHEQQKVQKRGGPSGNFRLWLLPLLADLYYVNQPTESCSQLIGYADWTNDFMWLLLLWHTVNNATWVIDSSMADEELQEVIQQTYSTTFNYISSAIYFYISYFLSIVIANIPRRIPCKWKPTWQ